MVARWFVFKPKIQIWVILEGCRLENVYIFYCHLEYFMEIWGILCPFGTFCIHLVHFTGFGIMNQDKSGNPGVRA
jgi:hypothetical protein